jgi:hypothetical protein
MDLPLGQRVEKKSVASPAMPDDEGEPESASVFAAHIDMGLVPETKKASSSRGQQGYGK